MSDESKVILSQAEFDDMPVAGSRAEAMANDIPTRYLRQCAADPAKTEWILCRDGAEHVIEIDPEADNFPEPERTVQPLSVQRYPTMTLYRWRQKWQRAKVRGARDRKGNRIDDENVQGDFSKRCDEAIQYYAAQIEYREKAMATPVRSSLPKKKQRELGLLPKLA